MAVFILIYSTVAGAIEKTWISGAIVFTAFGLLIGPVGLDLISFKANAEKNFVVIMKDGKIYKNTIQ
jgi:hypothetical protein